MKRWSLIYATIAIIASVGGSMLWVLSKAGIHAEATKTAAFACMGVGVVALFFLLAAVSLGSKTN